MGNKTRHSKYKKRGRPASSSSVRLTPHFRSPVDIERLGKALAAIALKQTGLGVDGVVEDERNGIQGTNAEARQGTGTEEEQGGGVKKREGIGRYGASRNEKAGGADHALED